MKASNAIGILSALVLCSQQATAMPTALSMSSNHADSSTLVHLSRRKEEDRSSTMAALDLPGGGEAGSHSDVEELNLQAPWFSHKLYLNDLMARLNNSDLMTDLLARIGHPELMANLKANIANSKREVAMVVPDMTADLKAELATSVANFRAPLPGALVTTYLSILQIKATEIFGESANEFFEKIVNGFKMAYDLNTADSRPLQIYVEAAKLIWNAQNSDNILPSST
ncbi:hypothetical protein H4R34_005402 [Dimargaris verticillata]|uniref:Uncharacterized protein n=1 Tax=Dimargaris verticillata TaxID=2761393 RepID=A0A9W8E678_9FUNG|nr:hypothetical protein H4R34_005402 [Dimargaris verticillata]